MEELVIVVTCIGGGYQATAYVPSTFEDQCKMRTATDVTPEGALKALFHGLHTANIVHLPEFGTL